MALDMNADKWVDGAQLVSGFAAIAAVWLAVVTARAGRRVPLTDAYMSAWQAILDVVEVAAEGKSEPPTEERSDRLLRQFNGADHKLSVIEATLRVRVYGREIRHDLKNLLIDVLYDNPDIRQVSARPLSLSEFPRPDWADCTDEKWLGVANSVPFTSMLVSEVWDLPGQLGDTDGLMRWYYPTVLKGLDARDSVTAPSAPPQAQLAFMLSAYVDAFLLPWIRDAAREALLGRLGVHARCALWRRRWHRWRHEPAWRGHRFDYDGLTLFSSTTRRR